jgi:hypothetical protein
VYRADLGFSGGVSAGRGGGVAGAGDGDAGEQLVSGIALLVGIAPADVPGRAAVQRSGRVGVRHVSV